MKRKEESEEKYHYKYTLPCNFSDFPYYTIWCFCNPQNMSELYKVGKSVVPK